MNSTKDEDKILVSRVFDKLAATKKNNNTSFTDFLDLYQQKTLDRILKTLKVNFLFDGGYQEAERKVLVIFPESKSEMDLLPIKILNITYNGKMFKDITHRDVLGAVMSLGIKREKIGDIILCEDNCQMIVHNDISNFIICNLEKIKNTNVNIKLDDNKEIRFAEQRIIEITGFVPSLRLDCIIEEGFKIPRSEASQLIKDKKVFVNWELISKSSFELQSDDTISVRGMGRLVFEGISGTTKKVI